MAGPARVYISEDDFLALLETAEGRFVLVDGEIRMMAGANQRHQEIAANTLASLHTQLPGSQCRPTSADTAIRTQRNIRYPDVVVDCGPRNDRSMWATTPMVVIEVLRESSRLFDSHKKLNEYKSHPDIRYVVLVDPGSPSALLHPRQREGWRERVYENLDDVMELPEIGASRPLNDVCFGLEFEPRMADRENSAM